MLAEELARHGGGRAEGDEDEGKSNDERERMNDREAADTRARVRGGQLVERDSGDERDVRGDERQDARRDERDDPGEERGQSETSLTWLSNT